MKQKYFYFSFIYLFNGDIAYNSYWCKSKGSLHKDIIAIRNVTGIEDIIILTKIEITETEYMEARKTWQKING